MGRPRHRDPVAVSDPVHQPLEPANTSRRHAELGGDSLHRRDRRRDHRAAHGQMILARRHWDQSGERTTGSLPYLHATEPSAPHPAALLGARERRDERPYSRHRSQFYLGFLSQDAADVAVPSPGPGTRDRLARCDKCTTWASTRRGGALTHVRGGDSRQSVGALRDRPARDEAALRHGG